MASLPQAYFAEKFDAIQTVFDELPVEVNGISKL